MTAGAVLRVGARVFLGLAPARGRFAVRDHRLRRAARDPAPAQPDPGHHDGGARRTARRSRGGRRGPRFREGGRALRERDRVRGAAHLRPLDPGRVLLGLVSTLLAGVPAVLAVVRPKPFAAPDRALPLRRLQSGHVGDYVAWVLVGTTVLGALTLPGMLGG